MTYSGNMGLFLVLSLSVVGRCALAGGGADNAATNNQLLRLNQWDWRQAAETPRQQHLQRSQPLPAAQQLQQRQHVDRQRSERGQLYQRQQREQLSTSPSATDPLHRSPAGSLNSRRLQQQQTQRFKAQSDNLRLQQDIQRRAYQPR